MTEEQRARRVLVVVAHPDDAEFGAAGTVAKWAREGAEIAYVLCTSGDKGTSDPNVDPADLAKTREQEQRNACALLGVKHVVFLRYPDGILQNTIALRRDIVREIRRFKPDVVVCQDPTRRWFGQGYLNHPDHRAAGDACLDAVFPSARDPHVFPELRAEGFEPHKTAEVYLMGTNEPDVWVDISDTIEAKIAALREHRSQIGDRDEFEAWVRERARAVGEPQGLAYAEAFKYFKLG